MRWGSWLSAVAAALIASGAGAAQGVHPASQGLFPGSQDQGDQPVQIDAKSLEVHDKSKIATFSGNVKVVQGDTTMTCNKLVVFYGQEMGLSGNKPIVDASSNAGVLPDTQSIRRIEARGDVTVVSKDQTATGDLGVYDLPKKTITLSGNVVVSQGKNVIHGGVVIVDTVTGNAHVEPALGTPDGRVRALIIPQKQSNGSESNFLTIGPGPHH
jgi:lipopolysaccharide export system protein LptA